MGLMSFLERRLQSMKKETTMTCVTERTEKPAILFVDRVVDPNKRNPY